MQGKTIKRIGYGFGLIIFSIIAYTAFYKVNQPASVPVHNKFVNKVSFYKPLNSKDVEFSVSWNNLLKKSSAEKKDNFLIEQVKPDGKNWLTIPNGKKFRIGHIQYVHGGWDDKEGKISKPDHSMDARITQIFAVVEPKEELNDYYKVTIKNIESNTGEKMKKAEYAIVKLDQFNYLIKK